MRWKMMELQSENGYRWNRTSVTFRHFCVCRRREMVIFREKSVHLVECCRNKANESSLQEKFLTLQYNYKRLQNEINLGGRVMRELFIGQVDLSNQIGRPATCAYWILIRTIPPPVCCESYGIRILMIQNRRAGGSAGHYSPAGSNCVLGSNSGRRGRDPLHIEGGGGRLAIKKR